VTVLCTYFDRAYLARGLVLHASLRRHWPQAELWVLCLDDETRAAVGRLDGVRAIAPAELEAADPQLAAARPTRSRLGWYLTCTPCLTGFVLARSGAPAVFYADADLCFFSSPAPVLAEFAAGSIFVHRHRPDHPDWDPVAGSFNVGLVGFRDDGQGRACLALWRERCLEWCELEARPGRFGDQKYLDEWPSRFDRLVIARHRGVGVGPWNVGDGSLAPGPHIDGVPVVFYHFSGLEPLAPGLVRAAHVPRLTWAARTLLYRPYLRELARKAGELGVPAFGGAHPRSLRPWIRALRSRALFAVVGGHAI
jgi:hypothetical protein